MGHEKKTEHKRMRHRWVTAERVRRFKGCSGVASAQTDPLPIIPDGKGLSRPVMSAANAGNEYKVKLTKGGGKKFHVMRFKAPHKCNLEELINPILERQTVDKEERSVVPETGEGSEYGRKRREEARKRRRGYRIRKIDPDDQPWVLSEKKKGGKHFIGRKEGTVSSGSSYFIFTINHDGTFEACPVENWYDFVPPVKYNFLDADEAEERFEQRNKTLNYFSIMLSKKLKDSDTGGEEGLGVSEGKEARTKDKKKAAGVDSGLLLTDSDSGGFSSDGDSEGSPDASDSNKGAEVLGKEMNKKKDKKKKLRLGVDAEAGEDTDEGDMESREVDYITDSSSNSEQEFQARQTNKDMPKDDEEIERNEQGEIDKGFIESSSSEDELTEKGKELKELMKKMSGFGKESGSEEEERKVMEGDEETESAKLKVDKAKSGLPKTDSFSIKSTEQHTSKAKKNERKRDRIGSEEQVSPSRSATPESSQVNPKHTSSPSSKKHKPEFSVSNITEEEVKRYLQRRPIASKDLVRKFINKKTGMERHKIVDVLHKIIEGLQDVQTQLVKEKLYLSLPNTD